MDLTKKSWFCVSILLSVTVLQALESARNGNMHQAPVLCLKEKGEANEMKVDFRRLNLSEVPAVATAAAVKCLDLSNYNITKLKHESFKSYKDLTTLLLKNSNIQQIDRDAFHLLKNLEFIDISENVLAFFQNDMFINNTKLKNVSLSGNPLIMLRSNVSILISSSLLCLELRQCQLRELSPIALSKLPRLEYLDLTENVLQVLSPETLWPLVKLKYIDLRKNRWDCGDDFKSLKYFVQNKKLGHPFACIVEGAPKNGYNDSDQDTICSNSSSVNVSSSTIESTSPARVGVSPEMSQEQTTGGISSDNEQGYRTTVSEGHNPETHTTLDGIQASTVAKLPSEPQGSEDSESTTELSGENTDGKSSITLCVSVASTLISIGILIALSMYLCLAGRGVCGTCVNQERREPNANDNLCSETEMKPLKRKAAVRCLDTRYQQTSTHRDFGVGSNPDQDVVNN
jgi:hypothetical protein